MSFCKQAIDISGPSHAAKVLNYLEIFHIRILVLIEFLSDFLPIHRSINDTEIVWRLVRRDRIRKIVIAVQSYVDEVSWRFYGCINGLGLLTTSPARA